MMFGSGNYTCRVVYGTSKNGLPIICFSGGNRGALEAVEQLTRSGLCRVERNGGAGGSMLTSLSVVLDAGSQNFINQLLNHPSFRCISSDVSNVIAQHNASPGVRR